jgi:VanZ family protein
LLVVLFCLLYGISDEFHQSFIPDRMPSILDLIADTAGAAVVVLIWYVMRKIGLGKRSVFI